MKLVFCEDIRGQLLYWPVDIGFVVPPEREHQAEFIRQKDLTYFFKALDLLWCVASSIASPIALVLEDWFANDSQRFGVRLEVSSQLHTRHPILQTMFLRFLALVMADASKTKVSPKPAIQLALPKGTLGGSRVAIGNAEAENLCRRFVRMPCWQPGRSQDGSSPVLLKWDR